jgi:hypothetical protein
MSEVRPAPSKSYCQARPFPCWDNTSLKPPEYKTGVLIIYLSHSTINSGPTWFSTLQTHLHQPCSLSTFQINGYWDSFPVVKQPQCDSNYSPPPSTKVKTKKYCKQLYLNSPAPS